MRTNAAMHYLPVILVANDQRKHIIACYVLQIESREYL
jgi:hypothetical protein